MKRKFSLGRMLFAVTGLCFAIGFVANVVHHWDLVVVGLRGAAVGAESAAYLAAFQGVIAAACVVVSASMLLSLFDRKRQCR